MIHSGLSWSVWSGPFCRLGAWLLLHHLSGVSPDTRAWSVRMGPAQLPCPSPRVPVSPARSRTGLNPRGLLACLGPPGQGREVRGSGNDPQHQLTLSQGSVSTAKPPGRDAAVSCPGWQRNPESLLRAGEPLKNPSEATCMCLSSLPAWALAQEMWPRRFL